MEATNARAPRIVPWVLRIALSASFLSAVADRFGFWGPPGAANVAWGDWASFVTYVGTLNWFLPAATIPALAYFVTALEIGLPLALLAGVCLRTAACASGVLLTAFALAMTAAIGVKAPLDYSVFSAAGGAFVLAAQTADDAISFRVGEWVRALVKAPRAKEATT